MKKTIRNMGAGLLAVLWLGLCLMAWLSPAKELSVAERRPLQQLPEISADALFSGSFMEKFASYTLDQFPFRDSFRKIKSLFAYNVLQQKDNNGIYLENGYAAKLEYPLNGTSVSHALKKFNTIYEKYLKDTGSQIYMTIIPDKGYYLAEANGYPAMDYDELFALVKTGMPWAEQVDITSVLSLADYYRTDTHWRQEKLLPVAQKLCRIMGSDVPKGENFSPTPVTQQFYGVYYGQAALPMQPETLYIMESSGLESCTVYNHETGKYQPIYDTGKLTGTDPYDVYLSGPQALLTVENPRATTDKELIVFRDSFGSSLVPLLVQSYRTVTLVDIRYVSSGLLDRFLTFGEQDVLFAYSTLILNSSESLK